MSFEAEADLWKVATLILLVSFFQFCKHYQYGLNFI